MPVDEHIRNRDGDQQERGRNHEHDDWQDPAVEPDQVSDPGVPGPTAPQQQEHEPALDQRVEGRPRGHEAGDVHEGEDKHEIEEEFGSRHPAVRRDQGSPDAQPGSGHLILSAGHPTTVATSHAADR
ncbi:hypothetical protein O7630_16250 [Micromonospora sp. WMMD718]|uniref:hypothetical protein n=1 Tax=Micromonospora sp. WMMD718 TaxID=3016098 RepID=UPI00210080E3|nr:MULTISPECIES: hypothetical protein [unclassified Micromonospora]MDG4752505.1 hypothetical protein [Micromonospora sp. WMMD718]